MSSVQRCLDYLTIANNAKKLLSETLKINHAVMQLDDGCMELCTILPSTRSLYFVI
jgi:hypothetical protein